MIQINTQKGKKLRFGVSVAGVQARDLKGAVRMQIGEIEYGFPAVLENGSLVVNIPPLDGIVDDLVEGQRFGAKLEVIAQDTYTVPWSDSIRIEKPITVEAQITEEEDLIKIEITAKLTEEKDEPDKKVVEEKKGFNSKFANKKVVEEKKGFNSKFAKALMLEYE